MEVNVINLKGENIKKLTLNPKIWNIIPNNYAIHQLLLSQQAALRQGTHKVKSKAEVSGSGIKPWKQKGTGRARQGSIRSPQWKGGGVVFGPNTNSNYLKKVNKKVKKLAIRSVLSYKLKNQSIIFLDKIIALNFSTKEMIANFKKINIKDQKNLFISNEVNEKFIKSIANIAKTKFISLNSINMFDLLNSNKIIICEDIFNKIEEVYA